MKFAAVLLLVLVASFATAEGGHMRKRFFFKEIKDAFNHAKDYFTNTYNAAKDAVKSVASHINFDAAVDLLTPLIHSGMTITACVTTCKGAAATVLGPAAVLAGTVCTPLCEGALAKLEELAG